MTITMANMTTEVEKATVRERLAFAEMLRAAYLAENMGSSVVKIDVMRKIDETIRIFKSQL